jgi:1-acyl-sn-glycerol-3-phosphate acyltransferase
MNSLSASVPNIKSRRVPASVRGPQGVPVPQRSRWLVRLFRDYSRRYIGRHFHALRVSRSGPMPDFPAGAVVVATNHASWWDPLIGMALASELPGWRELYAPIDARGLAQYPFLERLGFFGVEMGTTRGSLGFLRKSQAILSRPGSILSITAQGEFVDVRERPTRLKEGIGHLLHRLDAATVVTLAFEYPFWIDRLPEALVRFGPALAVAPGERHSPPEWTARIARALEENQDRLAEESRRRDPAAFTTLIGGTAGVGGAYDLWRRVNARLRGESFVPDHQLGDEPRAVPEGPNVRVGKAPLL